MTEPRPEDGAQAAADDVREPLVRRLGVAGLFAIAVNGTIGAGIFGTPGEAARLTGAWSPFLFLLCGLLMAPVVLSFCEVASGFSGTGGPELYVRTAFGRFAGFQAGWTFYVARLSAGAANVALIVSTLELLVPGAGTGVPRLLLLLALAAALTFVNVIGTKHAMRSIGVLTVAKFVPLLALVAVGALRVDASVLPGAATPLPDAEAVGAAILLLVYAFVGWEAALVPAGESREPARDMPRALLLGVFAATALYVLIQLVAIAALPTLGTTSGRPLVLVGEVLFGPAGAVFLTAGIVLSVGGNVASAMLSTPRVTYAMARAGSLPRFLGAVHPVHRTPSASIVVYGVLLFALAASGTFVELASISVLTRLLLYLAVLAALPRLRRRPPDSKGRFLLRGGLTVPSLAAAVCVFLLLQVDLATLLRTAAALALGTLLYLACRRPPPAPLASPHPPATLSTKSARSSGG